MKPCITCQGELVSITDTERDILGEGLYPSPGGTLHVPAGHTFQRERMITRCRDCGTIYDYIVVKERETTMTEEMAPVGSEETDPTKRSDLLEKVRRLSEDIETTKAAKKTATKAYNDELKDLEDELHDTLGILKDTPV